VGSGRSPRLGITEGAEAVGTPFQEAKSQVIREFEWAYLDKLMRTHRGNVSQAARASGKHRRALTELLRKHGLDPGEFRRRKTAHPSEPAGRRNGRD
jgi:DNA-binding NtrC family response regulator